MQEANIYEPARLEDILDPLKNVSFMTLMIKLLERESCNIRFQTNKKSATTSLTLILSCFFQQSLDLIELLNKIEKELISKRHTNANKLLATETRTLFKV